MGEVARGRTRSRRARRALLRLGRGARDGVAPRRKLWVLRGGVAAQKMEETLCGRRPINRT